MKARMLCAAALAAFMTLTASAAETAGPLQVTVVPGQPLLERTLYGQAMNCDFRIANRGGEALELLVVGLVVRDRSGAVIARLEVNDNGIAPGIETVPNRKLDAGKQMTLFNPFHTFATQWPLATLDYTFRFGDGKRRDIVQSVRVEPRPYTTRTRLRLPLDGRLLVWDGHDFYAHHRRFNFDHPVAVEIGFNTNAARYSYDFTVVDAEGNRYRGDGEKNEQHFSYGKPVLAPGDGTVVSAHDGVAEDGAPMRIAALKENGMTIFGNYVVIDHGNGEFSHLGHLRPGSVQVAVGDKVRAGQPLAQVGTSGSSLFPHLHYELARTAGTDGEGVPSQFVDFDRVLGSTRARADGTSPDSGDIVEAR
ncbi:MAG TPA: M23 family metallopeptidase [Steroidobacteraceae bacterium]|nr:M23 family metallopeptidase [Steroidobacteraceae bacterium]